MFIKVFVIWCIFFFVFICIPTLKPLEFTMAFNIIICIIMPGYLIVFLLGDSNGWYLLHSYPIVIIVIACIVYISSPLIYLWIAHLIMSRMERNSLKSKTKKGDILTLFGTNNKP